MKKYSDELEEKLFQSEEIIYPYGCPVVLKKSPSNPRPGLMDPYELETMKLEKPHVGEKKEGIPPLPVLASLMRDAMGFPNYNLNKEEIITKFEAPVLDGRIVEIWRYFKRRSNAPKRPAFIMIHGGGWVGGSVYVVENFCRLIAELADAMVFNIEYNKGPETPFPAAQNDCYNAAKFIYDRADNYGIDRDRIVIGGDSAGGNLALSAAIRDRNEKTGIIKGMALCYPCTVKCDASMDGYAWTMDAYEFGAEQKEIEEECLGLGRPVKFGDDPIELMTMQGPEDALNPYYSPMMDQDKSGMPEMLMMCCEYDGLRQQDEFYAMQMEKAGNKVRCIRYGGIRHAAIDRLGHIPQAEDMARETALLIERIRGVSR